MEKELLIGLFGWSGQPLDAGLIRDRLQASALGVLDFPENLEPESGFFDVLIFLELPFDPIALSWVRNWPCLVVTSGNDLRGTALWIREGGCRVVRKDRESHWLTTLPLDLVALMESHSPEQYFKRIPSAQKNWSLVLDRYGRVVWCGSSWKAVDSEPDAVVGRSLAELLNMEASVWTLCWNSVRGGGEVSVKSQSVDLANGKVVFLDWQLLCGKQAGCASAGAVFLACEQTELLKLQNQISQLQQELQVLKHDMDQIVEAASHDLKEPLRNVSNFVQLLKHRFGGKLDRDGDAFIGYAVEGVRRMWGLIDELLLFATLNRDPDSFRWCSTDDLLADAMTRIGTPSTVFRRNLPEKIFGNPAQLNWLFLHLLDNAFRYNLGIEKFVGVEGVEEQYHWFISVWDNGPGIPQAYQEKAFFPFKRLQGQEEIPGRGMGLAISRKVVHLHRGAIRMCSEPGQGTAIHIRLPKPMH